MEKYCADCQFRDKNHSNFNKHLKRKKHINMVARNKQNLKTYDKQSYNINNFVPLDLNKNQYLTIKPHFYETDEGVCRFQPLINDIYDPISIAVNLFQIFSRYHKLNDGYLIPFIKQPSFKSFQLPEIVENKIIFERIEFDVFDIIYKQLMEVYFRECKIINFIEDILDDYKRPMVLQIIQFIKDQYIKKYLYDIFKTTYLI